MERAWTDQRLDDFRDRVELRFDAIEGQMRDGFARLDRELIEVRSEIAGIHSTLAAAGGRIMVALCGLIVSLIGVIAAVITTG